MEAGAGPGAGPGAGTGLPDNLALQAIQCLSVSDPLVPQSPCVAVILTEPKLYAQGSSEVLGEVLSLEAGAGPGAGAGLPFSLA